MFKNQKEVNASEPMDKALGSRDWKTDEEYYGYLVDMHVPEGASGFIYKLALVENQKGLPVLNDNFISFWETKVLHHKEGGKLWNIPLGNLIGVKCTGKGKAKSSGNMTTYFSVNEVEDGKGQVYKVKL